MSLCRSCGAEITWARGERFGKLPLEPDPQERGSSLFALRDKLSPEGPLALSWWGSSAGETLFTLHRCPPKEETK